MTQKIVSVAKWVVGRRNCRAVIGLCLVSGLVMGQASLAAPTTIAPPVARTVTPATPVTHTHSVSSLIKNPHLRGAEVVTHHATTTAKKNVKNDHDRDDHHHLWEHRWDYHTWMVVHRGLGTIRGFVHSGEGEGLQGVRLALRHPGGRYFSRVSMRHVTYSGAGGNFVMTGVRAGKYRVIASRAKLHGHSQVAVHPGSVANVGIRV